MDQVRIIVRIIVHLRADIDKDCPGVLGDRFHRRHPRVEKLSVELRPIRTADELGRRLEEGGLRGDDDLGLGRHLLQHLHRLDQRGGVLIHGRTREDVVTPDHDPDEIGVSLQKVCGNLGLQIGEGRVGEPRPANTEIQGLDLGAERLVDQGYEAVFPVGDAVAQERHRRGGAVLVTGVVVVTVVVVGDLAVAEAEAVAEVKVIAGVQQDVLPGLIGDQRRPGERGEGDVGEDEVARLDVRQGDPNVGEARDGHVLHHGLPLARRAKPGLEALDLHIADREVVVVGEVVELEPDAVLRAGADQLDVLEGQPARIGRVDPGEADVPELGVGEGRLQGFLIGLRHRREQALLDELLIQIVAVVGVHVVDLQALRRGIGVVAGEGRHRNVLGAHERSVRPDHVPVGELRDIDQPVAEVLLRQAERPVDIGVPRGAGHDVVFDRDAGAMEPEPVALEAVILAAEARIRRLPRVDLLIGRVEVRLRVHRAQRDVADEGAHLVACLGVVGSTDDVVGDIADEVDIGGVVDIGPAGIVANDRPFYRAGVAVDAPAVEMDRVASAHIRPAELFDFDIVRPDRGLVAGLEHPVVDTCLLVGAPEALHSDIGHVHIVGVHEHDVPALERALVFRGDLDVAREIGHMDLEIGARSHMVAVQLAVDRDGCAIDCGDGHHLVGGRVGGIGARHGDFVADPPARRDAHEGQRGGACERLFGQCEEAGLLRAVHFGVAMEKQAAAHKRGVPIAVDRTVIGDGDLRRHIRIDGGRRGADTELAGHRGDHSVDLQLGVPVGGEVEQAVDPQGLDLRRENAVHGHGDAVGDDNPRAVIRDIAAPNRWIAPITGGNGRMRGLIYGHKRHRRHHSHHAHCAGHL